MYIKLGKTAINYVADTNDFMIISELINSGLSYESPVLVRTVNELDIWFTQDFEERDYMVELLKKGITLYLYKPISTQSKSDYDDQIDYEDYIEISFFGSSTVPKYFIGAIEECKNNKTLKYRLRTGSDSYKYFRWGCTEGDFIEFERGLGITSPVYDLPYNIPGNLFTDTVIGDTIKISINPRRTNPNIILSYIGSNGKSIPLPIRTNPSGTEITYTIKDSGILQSILERGLWLSGEDYDILNGIVSSPEDLYQDWKIGETIPILGDTEIQEVKTIKSRNDIKINVLVQEGGVSELYVWFDDQFVSASLLPQNLENTSNSLNLRSTLAINRDNPEIPYSYPEYMTGQNKLGTYSKEGEKWKDYRACTEDEVLDIEKIISGEQTLVYDLKIQDIPENEYLIIPKKTNSDGVLIYRYLEEGKLEELGRYSASSIQVTETEIPYILGKIQSELGDEGILCDVDESFGLKNIRMPEGENDEVLYPMPVTEFSTIPDTEFIVNTKANNTILYETSSRNKGIEFWSRTIGGIGPYDTEGNIEVNIEELEQNFYRLTLSRYDYSEVYEGYTTGTFGEERLDYQIMNNSKLVYCNLYSTTLPKGTWYLLGGEVETELSPEDWNNALDKMFDKDSDGVYPDFFLVPDIKKYYDVKKVYETDLGFLPIYKNFLDYARSFSTQFLIQNSDIQSNYKYVKVDSLPDPLEPETIYEVKNEGVMVTDEEGVIIEDPREVQYIVTSYLYKNEYGWNYTKDTYNYLIYFYRDMSIYGLHRPGYYAFLEGLLENNYTISSGVISYNQPTTNPYITEDIETSLQKYKSNYLVCNNQEYYYKKYQNGEKPEMTLWMRFTAGRIARELQKNKRSYIGIKFNGQLERIINTILQNIVSNFSIVRKIEATEFVRDEKNGTLSVNVNAYVNDLTNNNLNLNITINYTNNNNK